MVLPKTKRFGNFLLVGWTGKWYLGIGLMRMRNVLKRERAILEKITKGWVKEFDRVDVLFHFFIGFLDFPSMFNAWGLAFRIALMEFDKDEGEEIGIGKQFVLKRKFLGN